MIRLGSGEVPGEGFVLSVVELLCSIVLNPLENHLEEVRVLLHGRVEDGDVVQFRRVRHGLGVLGNNISKNCGEVAYGIPGILSEF